MDQQCIACRQTFIPDPEDNQEMCWECEEGIEPCARGTLGCNVDHDMSIKSDDRCEPM